MAEGCGKRTGILPVVLFFVTVLSRLPFTSKYLYHMDSVHFALALDRYDVTLHQPHPPGYFLYVMLGRLFHLFIPDANTVFITISILFSALAVVMVYHLGEELFGGRAGVLAAILAITSPNLWFHGEVALSYPVEAFFSVLVAFLCWKIYSGKQDYIWLSAVVLALAGGVRQNSLLFLFPLWLFSVKKVRPVKIAASVMLLAAVCLAWFIPMIFMTGGWQSYDAACRELWEFNTGHQTVFDIGYPAFSHNLALLATYSIYNLGGGLIPFVFAAYHTVRHGDFRLYIKPRAVFFWFWCLPAVLFYLIIYIHTNPGYALVLMPPLVILAAASVDYMRPELGRLFRSCTATIVTAALVINVLIFFASKCPVSNRDILAHDRNLGLLFSYLKSFDPSNTVILTGPYKYYGYRHIMYYLPQYGAYQVDYRVSSTGRIRKVFWGKNRTTFLSDGIVLSAGIEQFAAVFYAEDKVNLTGMRNMQIHDLPPDLLVLSGPARAITGVSPAAAKLVKFSPGAE